MVIDKVLVANRGEIAIRVMRTLREMAIPSVAVFSDVDRTALHVRRADEAVHIGASPSSASYLNIDRIIQAARETGANAIHPGYGFLSENAVFAKAVEDAGFIFIGPSAHSIRLMGSKTNARQIAKAAGTPVIPGTEEGLLDGGEALQFAKQSGFPVMLKAVAGGGGKGMRRVDREADLLAAFDAASGEAARAFGDGRVYIEKLIEKARHIEIQILGDQHGNLIHLGERECSVQRRHQKVIEECPSPLAAKYPELRARMGEAAIRAARAAGYYNAGTVEFLADNDGNFYFLEMNTRLQVEHPVTEWVTGIDLVRAQIEIARGEKLRINQEDVQWRGASIECRIYAEDPENNFFPSPGRIEHLVEPTGPGTRVDSAMFPGWNVPVDYDPILSKLSVWADNRAHARERMLRALKEYVISGIQSNVWFFEQILNTPEFQDGDLHTGFLDSLGPFSRPERENLIPIAAAVADQVRPRNGSGARAPSSSRWVRQGRAEGLR